MSTSNDALCHERQRLDLLGCTRLLDSEVNESFDRITRLAARLFDTPIALITLVDERRQWFLSRYGLDIRQTDRSSSFCSHAMRGQDVMVVEDTAADPRFADNPLVLGEPHVRFYAGAPLVLESGHALGSLCIIGPEPRSLDAAGRRRLADLAALVMAQIDLHQRAGRLDGVTRLPNRAQMTDDLEQLCAAFPGERRALMLLDVMSHPQLQSAVRAVGTRPLEATLREIAAKLRSCLPPHTALYHVSETRFSFLMPAISAPPSATPSASPSASGREVDRDLAVQAIVDRMREPFTSGGISVQLEMQAGLVDFELERGEAADVLRKATSAMHQSAAQGASHLWHDAGFDAAHRRAYALLRDISPALQRGEFRLVYQPKLNLRTGLYSGVEALARWTHPTHGVISPVEFIPLVESTTLIHEFTQWVLDTALLQLRAWQREGLELTVAVNVSSRNLDHASFVDAVRATCDAHRIAPAWLHIECTEHSVMTSAATQDALKALRALGAQISLDDFGMGFSNLSCLSSLPVQLLKIDQSLIKPIADDPRARQLVVSLIDMGHALGYRMLAEGVETQAVYNVLEDAGCDALQGFFLSRPLEHDALLRFMHSHATRPALA